MSEVIPKLIFLIDILSVFFPDDNLLKHYYIINLICDVYILIINIFPKKM